MVVHQGTVLMDFDVQYFSVIIFEWPLKLYFYRALLRKLHLYNIERMDSTSLCCALSACPSLLDLEIVGM
jgi:hypothetical protein